MGCSLCDCVVYVVGFFYSFYGPLVGGIALSKKNTGERIMSGAQIVDRVFYCIRSGMA